MTSGFSRRRFLAAAAAVSVAGVAGCRTDRRTVDVSTAGATPLARVDNVPTSVTRTWLAPQYWANRLADWRLAAGRLECVTDHGGGRTVGVLTRSVIPGDTAGSISVRTGTLASGTGFSGFLIGTGGGGLDWRAAALVMAASGAGGGFLAVYDSDGQVRFREHTDEVDQFAYAVLPAGARSGPAPARTVAEDVTLRLDMVPAAPGRFDLRLTAVRTATGAVLSSTTRVGVTDRDLVGGLSLISTPTGTGPAARHWLHELRTGGAKFAVQARTAGPVLGTLFSVSGSVLKLTAQFMPIGSADPQRAALEKRLPGTTRWLPVQTASIGAGLVALFRVTGWDSTQDWEYRVSYAAGTSQQAFYTGRIRRDPTSSTRLSIAMVNCTIHTYRNLDLASSGAPHLPGEQFRGLYTTENMYFPYGEIAGNVARSAPDLLVALGDQFYENKPTRAHGPDAVLDVLSRYFLWLWSFRDITRETPTVCLVDDHDMYQGNLWGWSGRPAPKGQQNLGGYVMPPSWVNAVQHAQCAHNPDAFDPAPVLQGISVYYCAFSYGGVSFAVLEDRKFKNTNKLGKDELGRPLPPPRVLLGERQERFLTAWAAMHPGQPKVCLTQTLFACVQTDPTGSPMADTDSNGAPVDGRRTALALLRDAGAIILSGDQHLGSLVRHGLDSFTDGPVQFTAPAAGSAFQRWFEPSRPLPNATGPNTGDFTDGFGNRLRVLAVANPKVSFAAVRAVQTGNDVGDRGLKREGYGIVVVDRGRAEHRINCWPWQQDPTAPGATQYPGWPHTLPFSAVRNG